MQLDDLTEERSIASIQNRTNLAKDVIENIFAKNFKALNRTQALGAISIIEREFKLDLSPLKEECKHYYSLHPMDERSVVIPVPSVESDPVWPKFLMVVIIGVLGYGGWYFFTEYYQKQIHPITVEGNVSDSTTEENASDETNTATPVTAEEEKPRITIEEEAKKLDITTGEKVEVPSNLLLNDTAAEANTSDVNEEKNVTEEANNSTNEEAAVPPERTVISLVPNNRMWFRITDLNSKKSYEFRRDEQYDFNMTQSDWLVGVQNETFNFVDKGESKEYGGRGKYFYRLDQSGITEIDEEKYRSLYR